MAGSVPRAIVELEEMRERVQDQELCQLVEILLRLLTGTNLEDAAQRYLSPQEQEVFRRATRKSS
jgi:Trm5-related predicted tRNA methylase